MPDGALDALIAAGGRRPECGALAPRLVLPSGETQRSVFRFPHLLDQLLVVVGAHCISNRVSRRLDVQRVSCPPVEYEVDYAMGAFLVLRRNAFDAVGGFDERQWMYAEDMDLSWRLRRAGWTTLYVPTVTIRHVGGAASDVAFASEAPTRTLAALYAWLERRRGRRRMLAFVAINLAGATLRLSWLWPLARLAPGRFSAAHERVLDWWRMNSVAVRTRRSAQR